MAFDMHIIHSNFGNNSLALIQWAYEHNLADVTVCHIDTGWAANDWPEHVAHCEHFVHECGFAAVHLQPRVDFEQLMTIRNGFPAGKYQWCSLHLKGTTLLQWLNDVDPSTTAIILYGKRQCDSRQIDPIPEFIEASAHHGDRRVWHPLHAHTTEQRDALLARAGIRPLPHASHQCFPCINTPWNELQSIHEADIVKTEELEHDIAMPLFGHRVTSGATGIRQVVKRARIANDLADTDIRFGCSAAFGCGE